MRIVRLEIRCFRSIRHAVFFPGAHNVYLGPNNVGKTAVLEALNLLLNPELGARGCAVDENDFFCRQYRPAVAPDLGGAAAADTDPLAEGATPPPDAASGDGVAGDADGPPDAETSSPEGLDDGSTASPCEHEPLIRIEAVIAGLDDDDLGEFSSVLVPWDAAQRKVIEATEEGVDPFASAERAIRPCFEAWYDPDEDEFVCKSFFQTDPQLPRDACPIFGKPHKRRIGFLIYRDFRALQRPITLEPFALFSRLLSSQDATPKQFEAVLSELDGAVLPLFKEENFARVVNEYRQELLRYLPLASIGDGKLSFEATDRTREQVKAAAQLYVNDLLPLPLQKMGAGTRSLAILAILLLIARKRGRGIIALEEPETFLFPHAQRRVIDEVVGLSSQTFVTTHSPYVVERMPVESLQRLQRDQKARVTAIPLVTDTATARQIRDRFRKQLSEALLGRGAIIVEEESTRLWLLRASALMHGKEFDGKKIEGLEYLGIAVVPAIGNGDVASVGSLLRRAGLMAVGFLDQVTDKEREEFAAKDPDLPLVFHADKGLEDLLLRELPKPLLREALIGAPYARHTYSAAEVDGWSPDEFTKKAREFLRQHKGYQPLHEWVLDKIGLAEMPSTFKSFIAMVTSAATGGTPLTTCSLVPGLP